MTSSVNSQRLYPTTGQYVSSPGHNGLCHTGFAVSSLAVARDTASTGTHSCLPMDGWLRLSRPGCLVLCQVVYSSKGGHPSRHTHLSTNRAQRRVTTLIESNLSPLRHAGTSKYYKEIPITDCSMPGCELYTAPILN